MAVLVDWTSKRAAKERLAKRLRAAKQHRKLLVEQDWRFCERVAFGGYQDMQAIAAQIAELVEDTADFDIGESIEINYAFKNLRLVHAQMSANPPVAAPRPESSDLEDRRAADSANQCMLYFLRQYSLQEKVDMIALDTLVYGIGIGRTGFNPQAGEILDFDESTNEVTLEGDIEFVRVSPWQWWVDPSATMWGEGRGDVRWCWEEITLSLDEVRSLFPDKVGLFKTNKKSPDTISGAATSEDRSILTIGVPEDKEDKFVFYAYFETGLPENGMMGRFCYHFEDGTLITNPTVNPNQHYPSPTLAQRKKYRATGRKPKKRPGRAYLPYHILTDIDVPGQVYGRSALHYAGPSQNLMRAIDSAMLEAVKVHGVARLVLPPGAKIAEESLSNSNVDVIKMEEEGTTAPTFIAAPGLPPSMTELRTNVRAGVDDMFGVNESMFGQQSREQSGFSMQYAVNQGSMIRRRLFNKYVLFIESVYRALLRLAIQHWDDPRMIKVLGKENAFDIVELRGIDIDGGYQIVTEYGTSLPLDPQARRDELLKLVPIYQQAGLDPKVLVRALKLNDIQSTEDILELSQKRMKEIIDAMVATNTYIPPRQFQDHAGMLAYCREYVMTSNYFALPEEYKALIEKHMTDRAAQAAKESTQSPGGATAPGTAGSPPIAGGISGSAPAATPSTPGGGNALPGPKSAATSPPIAGAPPATPPIAATA